MAQLPRIQSQFVAISGGMDLTTPPIAKANSEAISALNVQPNYGGGFSRIEGYECIDGKMIPSEMAYAVLVVGEVHSKERFHGQTFIHEGKQYHVVDVLDNAFVVAFLKPINIVNGMSFAINGMSFTAAYVNSSFDGELEEDLRYRSMAFQLGVDSVSAVPGTEKIRGVVELSGEVIAFRDNSEHCGAFISSNNGWSAVPATYLVKLKNLVKPENLLEHVSFTSGTVKGVIHSVALAPDSASGYVVLSQSVSANQPLQINGVTAATVENCNAVTLSKGKDWQFIYHNFYGSSNTFYAYGCNGECCRSRDFGKLTT